jgi:hypothetical protein
VKLELSGIHVLHHLDGRQFRASTIQSGQNVEDSNGLGRQPRRIRWPSGRIGPRGQPSWVSSGGGGVVHGFAIVTTHVVTGLELKVSISQFSGA